MSEFAVIAELPLGTYRARTPGGHLDPLPSPARLHAALVCAAAAGPRAVMVEDGLGPSDTDRQTLEWLEQHPPDGVALPGTAEVHTTVYGWRREGTLRKEGGHAGPRDKVVARSVVGLIAVDGAFGWTWRKPPPSEIRDGLAALCADVSHLGNAETPVRLRVGRLCPTHRRHVEADLFATAAGVDVEVAVRGRTEALGRAYAAERKPVGARADRFSTNEVPVSTTFVPEGREAARYLDLTPGAEPDGPWNTALLAGFGSPTDHLSDGQHVGWCTAVHRALISLVGDGAPALLTGTYMPGTAQPANRIAIQLLARDATRAAALDHEGPVLAVLLPAGAAHDDIATVADAFSRLTRVTWGRAVRRLTSLPARSARTFWPPASARRRFEVRPAAVPDTRPLGSNWTIADAVALSFGFVLRSRSELVGQGRGDARHRDSASRVMAAGLEVQAVERVMDGDLSRYVHRIHPSRVVQPYRARLTLGGLLNDRTLVCIGQSRHLGGGLLVPVGEPA